eukprot:Nitzschia sp. Nitz4//scaffold311_size21207//2353//2799//NITZ4_008618-RA/size21207-protein2genome-gene-0.9-mRNA-1//1//CDS//3329547374//5579//frame0
MRLQFQQPHRRLPQHRNQPYLPDPPFLPHLPEKLLRSRQTCRHCSRQRRLQDHPAVNHQHPRQMHRQRHPA